MKKILRISSLLFAIMIIVSIISLPSFATTQFILGDVDGNKDVNSADAIMVMRADVGLINLDDSQMLAADVNEDGVVDTGDIIRLVRYSAGMFKDFKSCIVADRAVTDSTAAANGNYHIYRNCVNTAPVDAGAATATLNKIIASIDPSMTLGGLFGSIVGAGEFDGNKNDTQSYPGNFLLKEFELTGNDIMSFSQKDGEYTINLNDVVNPGKTNKKGIALVTDDYQSKENIDRYFSNIGNDMIKINSFEISVTNAVCTIKVNQNTVSSIVIAYNFDVKMVLKSGSTPITLTGKYSDTLEYTNFIYEAV